MTLEEMKAAWKKYNDEYLWFGRVVSQRTRRADLHAFLLLDELFPSTFDIIEDAGHEQVFLSIDIKDLAAKIDEELIVELIRCGVCLDSMKNSLVMNT